VQPQLERDGHSGSLWWDNFCETIYFHILCVGAPFPFALFIYLYSLVPCSLPFLQFAIRECLSPPAFCPALALRRSQVLPPFRTSLVQSNGNSNKHSEALKAALRAPLPLFLTPSASSSRRRFYLMLCI